MPPSVFDLLSPKSEVKGLIGYYGLAHWWRGAFSDDERQRIVARFQPLGSSPGSLTQGEINWSSQAVVGFLQALAGWFSGRNDRSIAYKILAKADELDNEAPVLDRHFLCQVKLEMHYRNRDKPGELENAIAACREQIGLAPKAADAFRAAYPDAPLPGHKGYEQLAIILEKQGRFAEAIDLCQLAEEQGWAGNWEDRKVRCARERAKTTPT
ncbi:MAG: hypothetical protein JSR99_17940 [Proteobacteria bacterium]|nr:hypothetical protein [Pseudomonadota bacterium]